MTMNEDFDLEFNNDYLLIRPGLKNKLNPRSSQLWETLGDACWRNDCRQILSEVQLFSDEMTYSDMYFTARLIAENIPAVKIALFVGPDISKDLMEFVELTASNRGIAIAFFSDRQEAIDWLTNFNRYLQL